jgi:hypothetical protein
MYASFLAADGGVSTGTYNGLVKVKVSGFGEALATSYNDAFYLFTDNAHDPITPYNDGSYYQMAFNTSELFGYQPARDAKHFVRYDVDSGIEVTPTYVPSYRSDHVYTIVLDTQTATLSNLHFGVSNGIFSDNSGGYDIEITQLRAVPEPSTFAMLSLLGIGLGGWGLKRRRR